MRANSASSQGLHATVSLTDGFLWIRRLPRSSNLKCFTALVTYTSDRSMPASARAIEESAGRADKRPAGNILLIAGLLADHNDPRFTGTLS
jgi:hypothetical protein